MVTFAVNIVIFIDGEFSVIFSTTKLTCTDHTADRCVTRSRHAAGVRCSAWLARDLGCLLLLHRRNVLDVLGFHFVERN
jgi:hypothetical protein